MNIHYENRLPTTEEYLHLRRSVGWSDADADVVEKALNNSLFGVCATLNHKIIGSGRVIGDGGLAFYIQDVMVLPRYQRQQGIGTKIMIRLLSYLNRTAFSYSDTGLMASKDVEVFYQKLGCIIRPNSEMGAGMHCPLSS